MIQDQFALHFASGSHPGGMTLANSTNGWNPGPSARRGDTEAPEPRPAEDYRQHITLGSPQRPATSSFKFGDMFSCGD